MKISYYLNAERIKNLYCRISDGKERITFSLDYEVDAKKWNSKKEELDDEDVHHYTLIYFKKYLEQKYYELKNEGKEDVLTRLKNEAVSFTKASGIEGIAEKMFKENNKQAGVPEYSSFISCFEKFSGLKKGSYKVEILDSIILFHTKKTVYEMDSYEGLTDRLKSVIDNRHYDEIYTMTNENIWSEIYVDAGIEKSIFLPVLLQEWNRYWTYKYKDVLESVGSTNHLEAMKEQSWREFQVYMECYNDSGDAIKLAYDINEDRLYPIAVISMMKIFDADTCYSEYCEFEFDGSEEWESVSPNDNENAPILYVRPYEF